MNPFLLLLALPLLEILTFIEIGSVIGGWPTIALVLLSAMLGSAILRLQGQAAIERVRNAAARNEPPAGAVFETFCMVVAGILLIIPGFLTDALALVLIVRPLRTFLGRWLFRQMTAGPGVRVWVGGHSKKGDPQKPSPGVIDGDFRRVDDDEADGSDLPRLEQSRWSGKRPDDV